MKKKKNSPFVIWLDSQSFFSRHSQDFIGKTEMYPLRPGRRQGPGRACLAPRASSPGAPAGLGRLLRDGTAGRSAAGDTPQACGLAHGGTEVGVLPCPSWPAGGEVQGVHGSEPRTRKVIQDTGSLACGGKRRPPARRLLRVSFLSPRQRGEGRLGPTSKQRTAPVALSVAHWAHYL